jgi:hypothetical protein
MKESLDPMLESVFARGKISLRDSELRGWPVGSSISIVMINSNKVLMREQLVRLLYEKSRPREVQRSKTNL